MVNSSSTGYMAKLKTVSRQSAASVYSDMNISTVATSAVENYIRSFFETDGSNRHYLAQFAPGLLSYVADASYEGNDSTKTKLTIDRYNERLAAHPPCIIINDSGVVLKPSGFGRSTWQSRPQDNIVAHQISVIREIPISIVVAASSKSDLAALCQSLHTILYDISTLVCGKVLHPFNDHDTWMLRLPMTIDAGSYDKTNQTDDPQMLLWTSTIMMTCSFEDSFLLKGDDISYTVSANKIGPVEIDFPRFMRVGKRISGRINNLLIDMKVLMSDHNVASISQGSTLSEYIILAKRPGKFFLQVAQGTKTGSDLYPGQGSSVRPNIIMQQEITVTF